MSTPRPHLQDRCAVCGWPLAETRENGCRPGDCSMRPFPEHIFDLERANREYAGRHEFKGDSPCYVDDKTGRVVHRGGCGECPAEGVAAPLEPSAQEFAKAYVQQLNAKARKGTQYFIGENAIKFAEAYAAAVSKNLQEELAGEIKRHEHWQKLAGSLYENASLNLVEMSRLEKEIAALRETK